ncbi:NADH:flavin oxidoreductase/NADH oxidase [Parapedobacter lycopersici]|uniref:NADH:flavin oxidoreductase/NADH oxidase n=1 Tax=Parapedobacter lycopersici TaxID=1864939 RepID=UPI003341C493
MSLLFQPITIRSITARNRLAVSPMCQYSSVDGFANHWHLIHLGSRAVGGAGIVFTEATAVSPEGRISPDDLGIWKDTHIAGLAQVAEAIKSNGAVAGIQLAHAGRKASHSSPWNGNRLLTTAEDGWQTLAPSAVAYREGMPLPGAMDISQIRQLIADFGNAARRAVEAGFQVFEIHAAHGYLLNEFLSPLSNFRDDEYGGSFENRIRLLLQAVGEVRRVIPEILPLFVRISATEWTAGGWDESDSIKLAVRLKEQGVDLIDCSSGGNSPNQQIVTAPLYQVPYAASIRQAAGILTGAVGLITRADEAEDILRGEQADLVFMGRQLLRDPYFPLHAAKQLGANIPWPVQYERARP